MTNLSAHDEALLQERTGLTPEAIRTIEQLGFTLTRTASLLSYMRDLAVAAETRARSPEVPSGGEASGDGAAPGAVADAVGDAAQHE